MDASILLRDVVAPALDGCARNHEQARLIFNATPEVDSLAERIATLYSYDVPHDVIAAMFSDLRALRESNHAELDAHRTVARTGDDLARSIGATRAGLYAQVADHMTVTGIKRRLGGADGPLAVLAAPAGRDPKTLTDAQAAVRSVVTSAPDAVLNRPSLRNQLGASRHDLLLALRAEWGRADR